MPRSRSSSSSCMATIWSTNFFSEPFCGLLWPTDGIRFPPTEGEQERQLLRVPERLASKATLHRVPDNCRSEEFLIKTILKPDSVKRAMECLLKMLKQIRYDSWCLSTEIFSNIQVRQECLNYRVVGRTFLSVKKIMTPQLLVMLVYLNIISSCLCAFVAK